jgi:cellulose synthase/poly-beta-1,6-N-acetylglucosamine synthase-like glycosyltransferase
MLADVRAVFRNIVIALLSTYGLYILASILFFDVSSGQRYLQG